MESGRQVRYGSNTVVAGELLQLAESTALDIGCGDGKFTRFLARSGARATGLDVNPRVLVRARTKARDEVRGAGEHGFAPVTEVTFMALRTWSSFDEFAAEQAERGASRKKILAERGDEMRALFLGAARPEGDRLAFDQMFRVNLLRLS